MKRKIFTLIALFVVLTTNAQTSQITPGDTLDVNSTFPYAVGAVLLGTDGEQYIFDVALSKVGEMEYYNAIHFVFHSSSAQGIAGTYSLGEDSCYIDGEGSVVGSLELTYLGESTGNKNEYHLTAVYQRESDTIFSKIDKDVLLAGISDLDEMTTFVLDDDRNLPNNISEVFDEKTSSGAQKRLYNGILYIRRGNTRYTLQGKIANF